MKVAIAGYGIEGKASLKYWQKKGADVTIVDERDEIDDLPKGVDTILGKEAFSKIMDVDLIIRSPSIQPSKLPYGNIVWSATNEFFDKCPCPIVGVTGTKGKGTTCSLIAAILRASGRTVHLVGNIGVPALDILGNIGPNDVVIYELSSFQLWDLKRSPQIAVVLIIEPDHLDVHYSMEDYISAKTNIARYQQKDDLVIYHPTNFYSGSIASASNGKHVRYAISNDNQVYIKENKFFIQNTPITTVDSLQLPGAHNNENACASISVALNLQVPKEFVEVGLKSFSGLPHRLKFVKNVNGVKYYDDSIATTPGSAIASLKSFDEPKIIILGGYDKGVGYEAIVEQCRLTNSTVIAIGQTAETILTMCNQVGVTCYHESGGMNDILKLASGIAKVGDVVILSPASASFGQYRSYEDRGNHFIKAVEDL